MIYGLIKLEIEKLAEVSCLYKYTDFIASVSTITRELLLNSAGINKEEEKTIIEVILGRLEVSEYTKTFTTPTEFGDLEITFVLDSYLLNRKKAQKFLLHNYLGLYDNVENHIDELFFGQNQIQNYTLFKQLITDKDSHLIVFNRLEPMNEMFKDEPSYLISGVNYLEKSMLQALNEDILDLFLITYTPYSYSFRDFLKKENGKFDTKKFYMYAVFAIEEYLWNLSLKDEAIIYSDFDSPFVTAVILPDFYNQTKENGEEKVKIKFNKNHIKSIVQDEENITIEFNVPEVKQDIVDKTMTTIDETTKSIYSLLENGSQKLNDFVKNKKEKLENKVAEKENRFILEKEHEVTTPNQDYLTLENGARIPIEKDEVMSDEELRNILKDLLKEE